MAEKNKVVDDYYSNISDENSEKKEKVTKKVIPVKKKIVIKKANGQEQVESKPKETHLKVAKKSPKKVESSNDIKKQEKEAKKTEKKKIIQKITVIKKEDRIANPKNDSKLKKDGKKKEAKKVEVVKREDRAEKSNFANKTVENKNFKKTNPKFQKTNPKDDEEQVNKKKNNKQKLGKTRGKFRFPELEEEVTFTRSKVQKNIKKEEKKVEDIKQDLVNKRGEKIVIGDFIQLKELSEKIGVPFPKLIAEFMKNGMMVNINSKIDFETASIVAEAFEVKLERDVSAGASVEDIFGGDISSFLHEDDPSKLVLRPPVISIMGHVDHGKTSLLDYIRKSKVAAGEAGGITQSIGAYQVELESGSITFLDTPGHEAFTVMRARGAKSTDIAILVVAADEGVKPQTIESINHAKEADIPVIVAINKMDKEGANPDHIKGQLSEHGLVPEEWGGNTPMVPVSAHTGFGIDELLEIILLVAEMKELKANPNRAGVATVIESHLDNNLGPVATVLINTGTIYSGDNIVCADSHGKVKILRNYANQKVKFSKPGDPALIVGLDKVVEGGDILQVVASPDVARTKVMEYKAILEKQKKSGSSGLDLLMSKIKAGNLKQLKIILKADTNGSLEAIKAALLKLSTPETSVVVIHSGVGAITESDILMGKGSQAILIGFHVGVLTNAKSILETSGVEFISSEIIYHITERIEKIITGMLDPKEIEVVLGKAKVGGIFFTEKNFMIVGLVVQPDNRIETQAKVRVFRKKKYIGSGTVGSLKQGTLEVKEVEGPTECGIKFEGNIKLELGDELEFYKIEVQK
ncbi:translation initiation factor IF-2 [Candidatus Gracilibacteria bacterium]|nr:MAG: translation initiation factor IF-2 [Candidatus Gracilibacteria bacterium]